VRTTTRSSRSSRIETARPPASRHPLGRPTTDALDREGALEQSALLLIDEPSKGLAPKIVSEFAGVLERAAQHSTVLLVEQNLSVVKRLARALSCSTMVRSCTSERSATSTIRLSCDSSWEWRGRVNIFLVSPSAAWPSGYLLPRASGLSLIYGLMDVLNFAHGLFMTLGAYSGYEIATRLPTSLGAPTLVILAIIGATLFGGLAAGVTELILIRPLYGKPISQILITIGLTSRGRPPHGGFGSTALQIPVPLWLIEPTHLVDFICLTRTFSRSAPASSS